ncbi:MAG TPA: hypothetical protein VFY87_25635 [Geminicoccaceae bacterium]|nr:hypothetical protein [Geminicoccaceae bacterium]
MKKQTAADVAEQRPSGGPDRDDLSDVQAAVKGQLSDCEVLYRETGNPLFVWEALTHCDPAEPLPRWIFDYLRGCADGFPDEQPPEPPFELGLFGKALEVAYGGMTPKAAADSVARSLLLRRGATYNAFEDYRTRAHDAHVATYLDERPRRKKLAIAKIASDREKMGLGGNSRSSLFEARKRAHQLWDAQERARRPRPE